MGFLQDVLAGREKARKRDSVRLQRQAKRVQRPDKRVMFLGEMVATVEYYLKPAVANISPYLAIIKGDLEMPARWFRGKIETDRRNEEEYLDFLENCGFKK